MWVICPVTCTCTLIERFRMEPAVSAAGQLARIKHKMPGRLPTARMRIGMTPGNPAEANALASRLMEPPHQIDPSPTRKTEPGSSVFLAGTSIGLVRSAAPGTGSVHNSEHFQANTIRHETVIVARMFG